MCVVVNIKLAFFFFWNWLFSKEIDESKKDINQVTERIEANKVTLQNKMMENEKLNSQIVRSPERIKRVQFVYLC